MATIEGQRELENLKQMAFNWLNDYLRRLDGTPGWEFLVEDFQEELEQSMLPYLRRLKETDYITEDDRLEFCRLLGTLVARLTKAIASQQEETICQVALSQP